MKLGLGRIVFGMTMCLMLQSCASSPQMSQELQSGKLTFEAGNYNQAFHQLLPIAVNGRREAQYAVGYMYYYGYGTPQDTELGLYWIGQSVQQQYPPAIAALGVIQQNEGRPITRPASQVTYKDEALLPSPPSSPMTPPPLSSPPPSLSSPPPPLSSPPRQKVSLNANLQEDESDDVQKLQEEDDAADDNDVSEESGEAPVKPAAIKKMADLPLSDTLNPKDFTLQLFASYNLTAVQEMQTQYKLEDTTTILHTKREGDDWYVLTYGDYASKTKAERAKETLPGKLATLDPWMREIGELERV